MSGGGVKRKKGLRGQQSTALRVTSGPGASEGHRSSLLGGTLFLLRGLTGRERGEGRASLSGALSNSWREERQVQKLS